MKQDASYEVIKPIPLQNGNNIPKNTSITRTHGVYFMNGVMLPKDYQEDFNSLVENEEAKGWKYLVRIKDKIAFRNSKEGLT